MSSSAITLCTNPVSCMHPGIKLRLDMPIYLERQDVGGVGCNAHLAPLTLDHGLAIIIADAAWALHHAAIPLLRLHCCEAPAPAL